MRAALLGWYHIYHTFDSRRSQVGFPDLTLVRDGRLVFLELKTEKGKATAEQESWVAALALVPGVHAEIVYPRDLDRLLRDVLARRGPQEDLS